MRVEVFGVEVFGVDSVWLDMAWFANWAVSKYFYRRAP